MFYNSAPVLIVGMSFIFPLILFVRAIFEEPWDYHKYSQRTAKEPRLKLVA